MRTLFILIAILVSAASLGAGPPAPRSAQEVFDPRRVHTLHLRIPAEAWKLLQPGAAAHKSKSAQPGSDDVRFPSGRVSSNYAYVRSEIQFDGERITDLGVRLKGNSSYSVSTGTPRRPFKLDFDRFIDGQHFAGLSSLNLNNAAFDASQVRETFAFALFREMGIPAPRTGHALIYLTVPGLYEHEYLGLYTLVEEVDKKFLKHDFCDSHGLLLKPSGMRGLVYFGDDWSKYTSRYIPKNEAPPGQTQRVIELSRLINRADDATFRRQIESLLAVDEFLRYVAVNSAITNFDSFLSTGHNYYVYVNPSDGRCHFIPWDMNLSFGGYTWLGTAEQISACSITHAYADHNRLIERLLAIDNYAAAYRAHLRRLIDGPLSPEKLRNRFEATAPVFQAAEQAARDAGRAGSAATRPSGGMGFKPPELRTYIAERTESIRLQLDGKQQGFIPGFRDPELVPAEWAAYTAAAVAIIKAADADGDGQLNEAEISSGISRLFAAANLPATGALEPATASAAIDRLMSDDMRQRTPAAAWAAWLFSRADANKDGRLDATELLTAYRNQLATEDRDGDGMFGGRELIETLSGARAPRDTQVHR